MKLGEMNTGEQMNTSIPLYYFVMVLPLRISWTILLQDTKNKTDSEPYRKKDGVEELQ